MPDPTPCAHERITTASAEGLPSLWYCDDCRRRFYPACETCVDVGHRNETHPQSSPEAGLRERIRAAVHRQYDAGDIDRWAVLAAIDTALATPAPDGWKLCPTGYVPEDHAARLCKCATPAPDTATRDRETRDAFWAEHRCGDTAAHLAWLRDGDRLARALADCDMVPDRDASVDHIPYVDWVVVTTHRNAAAILAALEAQP